MKDWFGVELILYGAGPGAGAGPRFQTNEIMQRIRRGLQRTKNSEDFSGG